MPDVETPAIGLARSAADPELWRFVVVDGSPAGLHRVADEIARAARQCGVAVAGQADLRDEAHGSVCAVVDVMRDVAVARARTRPGDAEERAFSDKCLEHFSYLERKCVGLGATHPSMWRPGVAFERPGGKTAGSASRRGVLGLLDRVAPAPTPAPATAPDHALAQVVTEQLAHVHHLLAVALPDLRENAAQDRPA